MGKPISRERVTTEGSDAGENIHEVLESIESEAPHAF